MIRRWVDYEVEDRVIGWPHDLAIKQAVGWEVPQFSSDLNATAAVYEAMERRGPGVNERFLHLVRPGTSEPLAVCIAALQVVNSA